MAIANARLADVTTAGEAVDARSRPARVLFIDNVRWTMILFVLSMHAAVTYSPFGSWYYREHPAAEFATLFFFATYQSFLQSFFMALLFFMAGYFVPESYDRKGGGAFLAGRLYRLGLPTVLFVAVIGPVTEYFVAGSWHTRNSFAQEMAVYVTRGRFLASTGPLWFCMALLIFSFGYAFYRQLWPKRKAIGALPRAGTVALAVASIALVIFLVRIATPVGTSFYNMQLCYFPSYLIMFALGVAACRGRWLERVPERFAWSAAIACIGVATLAWLPLLAYGGALGGRLASYNGGLAWQSAAMATWESLVCVGMSFAVVAGFRAFAPGQGRFARFMSDNAFAVYVIHPPLLVLTALAFAGLALAPVQKFALLWALSAVLSFGVAAPLARRLPLVGRILA
jgi:hypothetical protein